MELFCYLIPNAAATYTFTKKEEKQQGNVATGMNFMPDIVSTVKNGKPNWNGMIEQNFEHRVCLLNVLGYIPGISTFSGAYRTLIGTAYLIKSIACFLFDPADKEKHREGILIGAANTGRGLLEIIPIIGNLFTLNIDASRMMHRLAERTGYSYGNSHKCVPYEDSETLPIIKTIDRIGAIPVIGTVVNLSRALFFALHVPVNLPGVLAGKPVYIEATEFVARQVGIGLLESIPIIGTLSAINRGILGNI